ncbi:hypothetical protein J6590_105343 [Homalodisca vitripennis]|nr:hypothetical protein J6590_105343 [Homalodisca vitripennis]
MCVLRNGTDEQHWTEWRVLVGGIERGGGRKSSYDSSKPSFPEVSKSTCYWTDEDQKSVYAMLPKPTSSILDCPESRRGLTQQYDNSVAGRVALGVTTHPEIRVTSDVS